MCIRDRLKGALRFKPIVLLLAIALLAVTVLQVPKMGMSFMPQVNSTQMTASLALDDQMEESEQRAQALELMNRVGEISGVQTVSYTHLIKSKLETAAEIDRPILTEQIADLETYLAEAENDRWAIDAQNFFHGATFGNCVFHALRITFRLSAYSTSAEALSLIHI